MRKFSLIVFTLLLTAVFGVADARAQTASVAGEWDAAMNTPGGAVPFKLEFKVDAEKLSGTVIRHNGDVPLEGTIKGNDLSFSYTISYNGHDLTLGFTGKVTGDKISGIVSFGGQAEDNWNASRAAAKPKSAKP